MSTSKLCLALAVSLGLAGCGSSGSGSSNTDVQTNNQPSAKTVTLTGVAATGAALNGSVQAVNAKGQESLAAKVNSNGTFTLKVPDGAPYLLKGTSNNLKNQNGDPMVLFSYATKGGKVNLTPLTTQAVFAASQKSNLKQMYKNWAQNASRVSQKNVDTAAKRLVANLQNAFAKAGVSKKTNIFTANFTPNGKGLDAVLDRFKAVYNCSASSCDASYTVDGKKHKWNYNIDTNSITIDAAENNVPTGSHTLTVSGSATVAGITTAIPNVVLKNTIKPANQDQFCGSDAIKNTTNAQLNITSCSFDGTTGRLSGAVSANGISTTFSYTYTYS